MGEFPSRAVGAGKKQGVLRLCGFIRGANVSASLRMTRWLGWCTHPSEEFLRIEKDGDGAVVDEFDLHVLLEASGFASKSGGADLGDEVFVERAGDGRRSSGIKRRALAAANVPEERELRNGENAAADIADRKVHFSGFVFENTKASDFFGEVVGVGFGISRSNAEQDEKSAADLARDFVVDGNLGAADALHHGTHAN